MNGYTLPALAATATTVTQSPSTLTKDVLTQVWQDRWLKGVPCHPPCWEGLVPGQTTAKEAVKILEKNPLFRSVRLWLPQQDLSNSSVDWRWNGNSSKTTGGDAFYASKTNEAEQLLLLIRPGRFPGGFKLGEVIRVYGMPSHAASNTGFIFGNSPNSGPLFQMSLLYLSQGMLIDVVDAHEKILLNSDTELDDVKFFEPGEAGFEKSHVIRKDRLVEWQGFKNFDFYCAKKEYCNKYP